MEWIAVSERLPEPGTRVLIWVQLPHIPGSEMMGAYMPTYDADYPWRLTWSDGAYTSKQVTHWMPLPEPPNKRNSSLR